MTEIGGIIIFAIMMIVPIIGAWIENDNRYRVNCPICGGRMRIKGWQAWCKECALLTSRRNYDNT